MLTPIVIDDVRPRTPTGLPAKGVVGQVLPVSAVLVADGHDRRGARLRWRQAGTRTWSTAPLVERDDGRWHGQVTPDAIGAHQLVVEAWTDRYATWRHEIEVKVAVGQDVSLELEEGGLLLEELADRCKGADRDRLRLAAQGVRRTSCSLDVRLDAACDDAVAAAGGRPAGRPSLRVRASTTCGSTASGRRWGPGTSCSPARSEGSGAPPSTSPTCPSSASTWSTCRRCTRSVVTNRKGRDGTLVAAPDDPGSPWAIGGPGGGHEALHPDLGTLADFDAFVARAGELGLEVALDYALQCSPDHPWVRDHPEWFTRRPDGTIRYAENPPKKYQDIHPIEFWPDLEADRVALWEACRDVLLLWADRGIRIFRVDNPHTKPLAFWEWVLAEVRAAPPGRRLPRGGVHGSGDDGEAGRGRVQPELHLLHVAHARRGSCVSTCRSSRRARWST